MSRQHNPHSEARHCWKPRDRARIRARLAIRERVANGGVDNDDEEKHDDSSLSTTTRRPKHQEKLTVMMADDDLNSSEIVRGQVNELLDRIIENDRSFFSLANLEDNRKILSSRFPIEFVWDDADGDGHSKLKGEAKLLSWYGFQGVVHLKELIFDSESFTFLDHAIIFQRYHIVGSFMLGGVNPCIRGVLRDDHEMTEEWQEELHSVGYTVLQRFFEPIPVTLSSYIAKRSFDLRMAGWRKKNSRKNDDNCFHCNLCARKGVPRSLQLSFTPSCTHSICEPCFWLSTLERIEEIDGDVEVCPCCLPPRSTQDRASDVEPSTDPKERFQKLEETRSKFLTLPKDGQDLQRQSDRKKRKKPTNGRFILSSNWPDAVKPFLGATQEIRTDRFFNFVDAGSFHKVKGCLDCGVDPTLKNQYGQTALYIAAWQGYDDIVRILLSYGSDPKSIANGGSTAIDAASANGFKDIVDLLGRFGGSPSPISGICPLVLPRHSLFFSEIISRSLDHPGAGSYIVDGILDDESMRCLVDLWSMLPVAEGKKKTVPCSERRYFCDIDRIVTSLLRNAVRTVAPWLDGVLFLSFMRFLCYKEYRMALAPHVDLSRVDNQTGKRSTHTFLLYLSGCTVGGATTLLESLSGQGRNNILHSVKPARGRLLLFPHACPHEGEEVIDVPKLLLRGEAFLRGIGNVPT